MSRSRARPAARRSMHGHVRRAVRAESSAPVASPQEEAVSTESLAESPSATPTPTVDVTNRSAKPLESQPPAEQPAESSTEQPPESTSTESSVGPSTTEAPPSTDNWNPPITESYSSTSTEAAPSTTTEEPPAPSSIDTPSSSSWTEDQSWQDATSSWSAQAQSSSTETYVAPATSSSESTYTFSAPASSLAAASASASQSSTTVVPVVAALVTSTSSSVPKTTSLTLGTVQAPKTLTNHVATSSTLSSPQQNKSSSSSTGLSSGAIAGIVVGSIVALLCLFGLFMACCRKRTKQPIYDQDKVYGSTAGANLKRNGTTHSALDFSDDPVSPAPRWRHLSHLGFPKSGRNRGSVAGAGVAGVGARGLSARGAAAATSTPPVHKRSMSTAASKKEWDDEDGDSHSPAVQVRDNEDFRMTHYDDWLSYNEMEKTPPPSAGVSGSSQTSLVPPVTIEPVQPRSQLLTTPQREPSYEAFNAYGKNNQPVLQRLPWLRVTPPVSPAHSYAEPSHAEFGIAH